MASQKIFTTKYVDELISSIKNGEVDSYFKQDFKSKDTSTVITGISVKEIPSLIIPKKGDQGDDIENVKTIFDAYRNLPKAQATDVRFWAYLTHVVFWKYMKARTDEKKITKNEKGIRYILNHWFLQGGLERNDIARLWWGAKLTFDKNRKNPYELTEIFFDMLDFTRTIFKSNSGKHPAFLHAFLEYVLENPDLFSSQKEAKVRMLARKMNALSTFKNIALLDKNDIKKIFAEHKDDLRKSDNNKDTLIE